MDHETLATLRYCIQRVLVPCVVIIGVLGNFISVIVLTRKRMRCSTNIYLTALAVADIIYLIFVFILSLQHYPNINLPKYKIYWSTIGLSHWFCDATTYTSIYLTVSFTIERYIAVCHPIRGQVLCTESRAKRVIAAVVILCFLLTMTTAFEHKLIENPKHININTFEPCIPNVIDDSLREQNNDSTVMMMYNQSTFLNNDLLNIKNGISKRQTIDKNWEFQQDMDKLNITDGTSANDTILDDKNKWECELSYFISHGSSDLANNTIYTDIFFYFTSIFFIFLPLILIATFNSFLIRAVHQSHKLRDQMTNTRPNHTTSSAQENKVTITLIAVVILFIICQTPTAIYLIFKIYNAISPNIEYALGNFLNFLVTLNASCNFLLYCALSNKYRKTVKQLFMGQKIHRKSTRSGIDTTSRYTSSTRATSYYSKDFHTHFGSGGGGGPGGVGGIATNSTGHTNNNQLKIRSRAQQPRRFSVTPTDYNNLQIAVGLLNPGKINDSPKSTNQQIENIGTTKSRKNSEQLAIPMNVINHSAINPNNNDNNKNQNDIINNSISSNNNSNSSNNNINNINNNSNNDNNNNNSNNNNNYYDNNSNRNSLSSSSSKPSCSHLFLKPSASQTSLTRSRSLILPIKTKHSPHCKDNPNKL